MPIEPNILKQIGEIHNEIALGNAEACFIALKDTNIADIPRVLTDSNLTSIRLESIQLLALIQLIRFSESSAPDGHEQAILGKLIFNFKKLYNGDQTSADFIGKLNTISKEIFAGINELLDVGAPINDVRKTLHRILYGALSLLHTQLPSNFSLESLAMRAINVNPIQLRAQITAILDKLQTQSASYESVGSPGTSAEKSTIGRFSSASAAISAISPGRSSASEAELFMKDKPPVVPAPPVSPWTWTWAELGATAGDYLSTAATALATARGAVLESAGFQAPPQDSSSEHNSAQAAKVAPAIARAPRPSDSAAPEIPGPTQSDDPIIQSTATSVINARSVLGKQIQHALARDADRIDPDNPQPASSERAPQFRGGRRRRPTPPDNVLTPDDLLRAVETAQINYRAWFTGQPGRAATTPLIERGFFHTQKGQQNVDRLVDGLREAGSVDERKESINTFLAERHGYKRHSFVAYLLDELVQITRDDSPWSGITANPDGTYTRELVLAHIREPHRGPAA